MHAQVLECMRNHDFALMHMENGRRRSSHAHQPLASAPIRQGADACAAADADSAVLCHGIDRRNVSSHEKRKKSI